MRIGYACLTLGVPDTGFKTCTMKNADALRLTQIISHNLNVLEKIIDYNIENNIRLFRISSDLIPFGSSPVNTLKWWDLFKESFDRIGAKIKASGMRVSMHPGQYTVINSPSEEVVARAVLDLEYHHKVLESLGASGEHKIILHIGGVYDNREQAVQRFMANYISLSDGVKSRLVIENDDKAYGIEEVLTIGRDLGIPVVFDNLHNLVKPSLTKYDELQWIDLCRQTWQAKDGPQKIHYSQQDPDKRPGAHSETIGIGEFITFYQALGERDLDIMLEVKDKNLSAVKCLLATAKDLKISTLEIQWHYYKYLVLEHSHEDYNAIRQLLKDKENPLTLLFYERIEKALKTEVSIGSAVNSAQHVWGYFKKVATEKETTGFARDLEAFKNGKKSLKAVKSTLWKLALKYDEKYLIDSFYWLH